jgi:hypothetical protein
LLPNYHYNSLLRPNSYIYGGLRPNGANINGTTAFDDVYILTLPAFVWIKWYPAVSGNATGAAPHHSLTACGCNVLAEVACPEASRHLIPRELKVNDDLRSLRLSVALLRNLDEYLMFHDEAERRRSRGLQTRQSNQTDKNIAYNDYLAHIYTDRAPKDLGQARKALTEDLRYPRRWLILINGVESSGEKSAVPGLGATTTTTLC